MVGCAAARYLPAMPNLPRLAPIAGLLFAAAGPVAHAQTVPTRNEQPAPISQEQFLALMGRLDALEKRNDELEKQVSALRGQAAVADKAIAERTAESKVSMAGGRPTFSSADGQFTASLRGVAQLDAATYDQDAPGPAASDFRRGSLGDATEAERARDLADGTNLRRVRLGIEGKAWGDWGYNILVDFGGSGVEEPGRIISAYVDYAGLKGVRLRAGAFPQTTGLEDATSSSSTLFLERAAAAELVRNLAGGDGRTGLAAMASGARWSLAGTLTGGVIQSSSFDEQTGFIGRATFAPVLTKATVVHLGATANLVFQPAATGADIPPAGAATPVRLRERPELRVDGTRLVDTGSIDADGVTALGLELGLQHRNLSLQGEHFWIDVERRAAGLPDPEFSGWYVQGAWTITGEPRRYSAAAGGFDAPKVEAPFDLARGTWGVWELAARYSDLDLDYLAGAAGTAPVAGAIRGGEQKILTLGLNWYPNGNVRFLADYQRVDVVRLSPGGTAFGAGGLTPPAGAQIGQDYDVWSIRTQYAF